MTHPKCKCSMSSRVRGDGCRYCLPQEYIDRLEEYLDEERQELKELTDHINKVWEDTYPGAVPADSILALKCRITNLAEDRNCWVFNTKVLNNKLIALEGK